MKKAQAQTQTRNRKQCRIRSSALAGVRLRRNAAAGAGGRRSGGHATPLLKWKLEDADLGSGSARPESDKGRDRDRVVSARNLAAGIWLVNGGLGFERNVIDPHNSSLHANPKNDSRSPILTNHPKNGIVHKHGACSALANPSMERATKWDPVFYSHSKLFEDSLVTTVSDVSYLRSELEQARTQIAELESERHSAKKKLDHVMRKLSEEKESWRRREHEKIRAVIDSIKDDFHRERKNRQRVKIVNSKLVNELTEAKLSAKRFLQDYEKERKTRELMEEVCDELAKEIGDDKAEVEQLKADAMRMREEVEEERKMLQMAEVWREERVQMKLVDAKVTLEEKYSQLGKLQVEIEAFLRGRNNPNPIPNPNPNEEEEKEAVLLKEAVESVEAQEVKEFSYQPPPASEDIFSVFEELQPKEGPNEREIEACYGYTNGHINGFPEKPVKEFANGDINNDESGWETVSHAEEQGSSNSIEGSDPSVNNGICEESNSSVSGTDRESNSEISEVCSVGMKLSRKKGSSIARLWRSSYQNHGEKNGHRKSFETINGRVFNATQSPNGKSEETGLSSPSVRQWSSPDSVKAQINLGIKGFIEWPRGMQKHSLKSKLLEARIDSQKIQLRQALKQKI